MDVGWGPPLRNILWISFRFYRNLGDFMPAILRDTIAYVDRDGYAQDLAGGHCLSFKTGKQPGISMVRCILWSMHPDSCLFQEAEATDRSWHCKEKSEVFDQADIAEILELNISSLLGCFSVVWWIKLEGFPFWANLPVWRWDNDQWMMDNESDGSWRMISWWWIMNMMDSFFSKIVFLMSNPVA